MESKGIRAKGLQVRILSPRPNNSVIWCDNPRHTATSLKQAFFPLPKNHRDIPRHSATLKKTPWRHPEFPSPLAAAFYLPKAPLRDDQIAAGDSPFGQEAPAGAVKAAQAEPGSKAPAGWNPALSTLCLFGEAAALSTSHVNRAWATRPGRRLSSPSTPLNIKATTHGLLRAPFAAVQPESRVLPALPATPGPNLVTKHQPAGSAERRFPRSTRGVPAGIFRAVTSPRLPSLPTPSGEGIKSPTVSGSLVAKSVDARVSCPELVKVQLSKHHVAAGSSPAQGSTLSTPLAGRIPATHRRNEDERCNHGNNDFGKGFDRPQGDPRACRKQDREGGILPLDRHPDGLRFDPGQRVHRDRRERLRLPGELQRGGRQQDRPGERRPENMAAGGLPAEGAPGLGTEARVTPTQDPGGSEAEKPSEFRASRGFSARDGQIPPSTETPFYEVRGQGKKILKKSEAQVSTLFQH